VANRQWQLAGGNGHVTNGWPPMAAGKMALAIALEPFHQQLLFP
jgi:hypothetical protein